MSARTGLALGLLVLAACGGTAPFSDPYVATSRAAAPVAPSPSADVPATTPDLPFRASAPAPAATRGYAPVPPEEAHLSNGIRVLVLDRQTFPMVEIGVVIDRGAADADPGIGLLFGEALVGSTRHLGTEELYRYLHQVGAHWSSTTGTDRVLLTMKVLRPYLGGAMTAAASMVTEPAFKAKEVENLRHQLGNAMTRAKESSSTLADMALSEQLFPKGHPQRLALPADAAGLDAIGGDVLRRYHAAYVAPERITIVAAGDVRADDFVRLAEQTFGRYHATGAPPRDPTPLAPGPRHLVVVDHHGGSQASLALGYVTPSVGHADNDALDLLGALLAGSLSGRLSLKLRGEHGFTYGVEAGNAPARSGGSFRIATAVETAHAAASLRDVLSEIERMKTEPIDDAELERAKARLDYGAPTTYSTVDGAVHSMASLATYGLPLDFHTQRGKRRRALTSADVARVATTYLRAENVQIIVAGEASQLTEPLRILDIGKVAVR